jgi:hypothetical protein
MQPIAEALSSVTLAAPVQFENLAMFPILAPEDRAAGYLLLDDALEQNVARVTEISESGSVPELRFTNDAEDQVLLVDGDELVGARQNRILNLSILVGGKREIVVPVSCVEQGRWHWKSRHFTGAKRTLFAKARAKKMMRVSMSLRDSGVPRSNQGEIWQDIRTKADYLKSASETGAMSDIYEQQEAKLGAYVKALQPVDRQAGALFAVNGRIVGLELFDSAATFRKFMEKLVRSYALDAIEEPVAGAAPPIEAVVGKFLADMQAAALSRFPAVGEGEDLRFESAEVAGGALYAGNRVVHLCAFKVERPAASADVEARQ